MLVNLTLKNPFKDLRTISSGLSMLMLTWQDEKKPQDSAHKRHHLMAYRFNSEALFTLDVRPSEVVAVSNIDYVAAASFDRELKIWFVEKPINASDKIPFFTRTFDGPVTRIALNERGTQCAVVAGQQLFVFACTNLEKNAEAADLDVQGTVTKLAFFGGTQVLIETKDTTALYKIG